LKKKNPSVYWGFGCCSAGEKGLLRGLRICLEGAPKFLLVSLLDSVEKMLAEDD
jgi:hypothetical protein